VEELLDDVPRGLLALEQAAVFLGWDIYRCGMPGYAASMQEGQIRRLDSYCIGLLYLAAGAQIRRPRFPDPRFPARIFGDVPRDGAQQCLLEMTPSASSKV